MADTSSAPHRPRRRLSASASVASFRPDSAAQSAHNAAARKLKVPPSSPSQPDHQSSEIQKHIPVPSTLVLAAPLASSGRVQWRPGFFYGLQALHRRPSSTPGVPGHLQTTVRHIERCQRVLSRLSPTIAKANTLPCGDAIAVVVLPEPCAKKASAPCRKRADPVWSPTPPPTGLRRDTSQRGPPSTLPV